ncbi:MAG TPA: hypothetical protein VH702_03700 [Vicinamibacterales bacterium]
MRRSPDRRPAAAANTGPAARDRSAPEAKLKWGRSSAASPSREISYRQLVHRGALAVIRYANVHGTRYRPMAHEAARAAPDESRGDRALADKIARMAWAMMAKGECYREPIALAR